MEVINIIENEDGSETWTIELTDEENILLIRYAILDILEKFSRKEEEKKKSDDN